MQKEDKKKKGKKLIVTEKKEVTIKHPNGKPAGKVEIFKIKEV